MSRFSTNRREFIEQLHLQQGDGRYTIRRLQADQAQIEIFWNGDASKLTNCIICGEPAKTRKKPTEHIFQLAWKDDENYGNDPYNMAYACTGCNNEHLKKKIEDPERKAALEKYKIFAKTKMKSYAEEMKKFVDELCSHYKEQAETYYDKRINEWKAANGFLPMKKLTKSGIIDEILSKKLTLKKSHLNKMKVNDLAKMLAAMGD